MLGEFLGSASACALLSQLRLEGRQGEGEPPQYCGDILSSLPDCVWAEDRWTEARAAEARRRVALQGRPLPPQQRVLAEVHAAARWHEFYRRNSDHFYKDRHYLHRVFPALRPSASGGGRLLLEVGCGVGNACLPLLEQDPALSVVAVDFAPSAIALLQTHPMAPSLGPRLRASVCDLTRDPLPVALGSVDFVLCFFVLSAIAPSQHRAAADRMISALRPGGKLLFRDYGRYDEAQLRFGKGRKLADNLYVRQDGTCAYYFALEDLRALLGGALREEKCAFVLRQQANRKLAQARYRVWVEATFSND